MAERRPLLLSLLLLLAVLATGGGLVYLGQALDRAERRRAAAEVASRAAYALEQQLSGSLAAAHALAAVVRHTGDAVDFERVARELYQLYPGIDSLQLAPGGVLRHIYPLEGNEPALGLDLTAHPLHAPDVVAAKATRQLVLAGPFALKQGGVGLAGRVAVFTHDGGTERFWGIASTIVRVPRLLESSRIQALTEAGYDYELTRPGRGGAGVEVIARSGALGPLPSPVEEEVRVSNGDWLLRVAPRAGWGSPGAVAASLVLTASVALAFALLSYRVLRQPEELRREVATRTGELEQALRDVQATEAALRQAQKMEAVGRLAGGIAHDFNNLLQAIQGYVEMVAGAPELPGHLRDDLAQAQAAAERAAALTRQMLAFGRRQVLAPTNLDLNEVVQHLMKMVSRLIGEHITLEVVPGPDLGTVWADRGQIEQVLLNLCVNARDAMPDGGTLTIETQNVTVDAAWQASHPAARPGRYVLLRVTDTGTGIPAEHLPHIFEPFFTTKEQGKGTGLGLATLHGIVHQHQGMVQVYSEPGRGTTFKVYLPAVAAEVGAAASRTDGPVRGGAETILLAEDDPAVRLLAERVLRDAGYTVVSAADGAQAVELGTRPGARFDLALLDVVMPGLGGRHVRDRLLEARPDQKVLFASGYSEHVGQTDFVARDGQRLLDKPYSREGLLRAVRAALDG
jgi:signal transduction histidine kinase